MTIDLKTIAQELNVDYSGTSLVDLSSKFWSNQEFSEENLQKYVEKRLARKIVIQKFWIKGQYAIIYFFDQKDLELYLERLNEKNLHITSQ
jgi:hypothetical protein